MNSTTLYGSETSPFVRRLRLLFSREGVSYSFEKTSTQTPEDRARLKTLSPIMKIPVLRQGEQTIWDSRQIFRHLQSQGLHRPLSWEEENDLTAIDGLADTLVNLYLLKRSGFEVPKDSVIGVGHWDRMRLCPEFLSQRIQEGHFQAWDYPAMCLYSVLEWTRFRELHYFTFTPEFEAFLDSHQNELGIAETSPR